MHRFRKKSDVKRGLVPDLVRARTTSEVSYQSQTSADDSASVGLPGLPPESDFRTSLILPDLSRRFSLLRSPSGTPLSLDELRSRIAEQRAKGAENQLSEEQEEMVLESLRLRMKYGTSSIRDGNSSADSMAESSVDTGDGRHSMRSTTTTNSSSLQYSPSSPRSSGRPSKRYSNNIFGSSRLRSDYGYLRSISSQRSVGSSRSAVSAAPTETSGSGNVSPGWRGDGNDSVYTDSLRPTTPENRGTDSVSASVTSSPNDKTPLARPTQLSATTPMDDGSISSQRSSASEKRPSRAFTPAELVNMSIALEDVIREMEEEAEDEIVMPRSNPVVPVASEKGAGLSKLTTPTALSSDKSVRPLDVEARRGSPAPHSRSGATSPRLPGYIPGMPRPMTPRDTAMDSDDQGRSHSTTPRAMSPLQPGFTERPSHSISSNIANGIVRRDSNASTVTRPPRVGSPLGGTPLFTCRSINGRFTPDDRQKNGDEPSGDHANGDSTQVGRRPVSPFTGNGYQRNGPSSRPGTPSNIRWNTSTSTVASKSNGQGSSVSGHSSVSGRSRSESAMSDTDTNTDLHANVERKSTSRSLRSPALPDSPLIDGGNPSIMSRFDGTASLDNRPPSSISGELGSPILMATRPARSPTPTQSIARSSVSPAFVDSDARYTNGDVYSTGRSPPSSPFSPNRLAFSPMANSSHSSLESAGSSYHSWDEEGKRDRVYGLFKDLDPEEPVWHDLVGESSTSTAAGSYADDDWDPEAIIRRYAGLTKSDFAAIQDKLVKATVYKTTTPESRPPSLRRRRPSTSHSVVAAENRATSPAPQTSVPSSPGRASNRDNYAKANALLNSVIDSIQSPRSKAIDLDALESPKAGVDVLPSTPLEPSSPSSPHRRRRDLDDVLFGSGDSGKILPGPAVVPSQADVDVEILPPALATSPGATPTDDTTLDVNNVLPPTPAFESHSAVMQISSKSPLLVDPTELAKDVQRRAEEATAALRKIPSNSKLRESRKPINRSQISSPHLVLASTSVDTIPLPNASPTLAPAQMASSSKIGQRIRKIRGTFRHRPPALNGEEITPFPLDLRPNQSSSPSRDDHVVEGLPSIQPPLSAMEPTNPTFSVTSPPASAPGFKGLISRWRKPRNADMTTEQERLVPVASPSAAASSVTLSPSDRTFLSQTQSAPAFNTKFPLASPTDSRTPTPRVNPSTPKEQSNLSVSGASMPNQADEKALQQLFDAAEDLGLNPEDVSDLLVRSSSTSSRPLGSRLTRNTSNARSIRSQKPFTWDRARSPLQSDGRPSLDSYFARPSENIARKLSLRSRAESRAETQDNETSRHIEAEDDARTNAIVRRTIIMPSDTRASTFDLSFLTRKSSKRRRPASTTSAQSNRSVHDRAPTPPPPKSPTSRRFSEDASPPVPQLPMTLSAVASENSLQVPGSASAGQMEKSSSAYDSLYEMYAGEGKGPVAHATEPPGANDKPSGRPSTTEPPPAIEVVEMANGETIWSIVNGLRDDDGESIYASRASFLSEYSLHDSSQDGMQVFFKEHGRKSSKSSSTSYLSKKTPLGQNRPETKVFYSSPAQIGRLIENLSRGMDAGSFNFASRGGPDHSEAEMNWTVEERLEYMLGTMAHSS
ncbi:hypothetical protein NEOLEDRAFT_1145744 [Neolentinus lepideus HHB14362 ss-1]|uniref:Uncharacterized protein n=1 Tax=Neolentinus lepideus HHB14362 ss-1 TaxID=1314782 RepID=A0A165UQ57_9AGAM|nr:hypothetical protein NEOLEDRAFT_1145744 [Neolentinus lepideus HHB14362 ss-1]